MFNYIIISSVTILTSLIGLQFTHIMIILNIIPYLYYDRLIIKVSRGISLATIVSWYLSMYIKGNLIETIGSELYPYFNTYQIYIGDIFVHLLVPLYFVNKYKYYKLNLISSIIAIIIPLVWLKIITGNIYGIPSNIYKVNISQYRIYLINKIYTLTILMSYLFKL